MDELVVSTYKEYLKKMVVDGETCCYTVLLKRLDLLPYFPNSRNTDRYEDAEQLRIRYGDDNNIADILSYFSKEPITVFEVLLALSIRIEEKIMVDDKKGNRTSQWFWALVNDIGLCEYDDDRWDLDLIDNTVKEWMSDDNPMSLWRQAMKVINSFEGS